MEPVDRNAYEQSLKYYHDMKNVIDTAVAAGRAELKAEHEEEIKEERRLKEEERRQKELLLAKLKSSGMSDDEIQKLLQS